MHKQYLEFYKGYVAKEAAIPIRGANLQQFFRLMASLMRNGGQWLRRHPRIASWLTLLGTTGGAYGVSRMVGGNAPIDTNVSEDVTASAPQTPQAANPVQKSILLQNNTQPTAQPASTPTKGVAAPQGATQASAAQSAVRTAQQRNYPAPTKGTFRYDNNSPQIEYKQYAAGDPRLKYYQKRLKNMGFARFGENDPWIATPHGTDIQRTIPKGLNRGRLKELLARGMVPRGVFEDTVLFDKEPHV